MHTVLINHAHTHMHTHKNTKNNKFAKHSRVVQKNNEKPTSSSSKSTKESAALNVGHSYRRWW